jgi:hypothetical protein
LPGTEAALEGMVMGCFEDYLNFREEVEQIERKKDRKRERNKITPAPCILVGEGTAKSP